jgi:purine-binding chemotaxis protein CheW
MAGSNSRQSENVERILKERAEALARPPVEREDEAELVELLVMKAGDDLLGVELSSVQEVRPLGQLTWVPGLPEFWAGLINLRGSLYPVLDLGRYLGLNDGADVNSSEIVIVSGPSSGVALCVDRVPGVRRVRRSDIGPSLGGGSSVVRGVTTDSVSVLDLKKVLADGTLVVHDEVG